MRSRFLPLFFLLALTALNFGCDFQKSEQVSAAPGTDSSVGSDADPAIQRAHLQIEKSPESPIGYTQLAALFVKKARETGDFAVNSKAEAAVARALEISPNDGTARKLQASLALTFHRFSDALGLGTKLIAEFPSDAFAYGVLTDANAELGNYDAAVAAAQKMVDLKPNTASYARVAHLRSLYGDHEGAVEMFKSAARTADPFDKEAQSWCLVQLGDELWKNGKYPEAERVYDEALRVFPNFYLATAAKGKIRAAQGDLAGAEKLLIEAQYRVPNVESAILLGAVYTLSGQTEMADQQAKLVEAVEEKLAVAGDQKQLALFWADRDIRLVEALAISEKEYGARKDIYTADVYAWCLYKNGRYEEAKKIIQEAMRLKTKDARIMYHAGMIDAALGDKKSSRVKIAAALKLHPAFDLLQAKNARAAIQ